MDGKDSSKANPNSLRDPALFRLLLATYEAMHELYEDEDTSPEALDCGDSIMTAFETYTQRMKLKATVKAEAAKMEG
jgi:hypothetical protein